MFLKRRTRPKTARPTPYYSVCESLRVSRHRVVQRQVLQLTEAEAAFRTLKSEVKVRPIRH